MTMAVAQNV